MDRLTFGSWRWEDTLLDVVNTLFWPLVLMIGLRLRRPHGASDVLATGRP
jgi:hypothetical protein